MTTRPRKVHYKRAQLLTGKPLDLQDLLHSSLAKLRNVQDREEKLFDGGGPQRAITDCRRRSGNQTGKLLQYTPGHRQSFLELNDTEDDFVIDATSPPASQKKAHREFIDQIIYFLVRENHVCFLGPNAHSSKALEDHLNWLLDKAGAIDNETDRVLLADQPVPKAKEMRAHRIELGTPLEIVPVSKDGVPLTKEEIAEHKSKRWNVTLGGDGFGALKAMLGNVFGDAPLTLPTTQERIDVSLVVKYVSKNKSEEGFDLMRQIAIAGRHWDEDDVRVGLYKGGTLVGKDFKMSWLVDVVTSNESGLVDDLRLWGDMRAGLEMRLAGGQIRP